MKIQKTFLRFQRFKVGWKDVEKCKAVDIDCVSMFGYVMTGFCGVHVHNAKQNILSPSRQHL